MRRAECGLSSGEFGDRGDNKFAGVNIVGRTADFCRIFQNSGTSSFSPKLANTGPALEGSALI